MDLIKNLNTINKYGKLNGLFHCPKCEQSVIKARRNGI